MNRAMFETLLAGVGLLFVVVLNKILGVVEVSPLALSERKTGSF